MSDEIKSSRDIVLERLATLDDVTPEERLKWKYTPEGEQIAIKYFKEAVDFEASISAYPAEVQAFIRSGAEKVLLENIQLPINDTVAARNNKAMSAILYIKSEKTMATKLLDQMKHILGHYTDQGAAQRKEAREMLKQQFEAKLKQAVKNQIGYSAEATDLGISVETLPQFQDELRRTLLQMDNQYLGLLEKYKQELHQSR